MNNKLPPIKPLDFVSPKDKWDGDIYSAIWRYYKAIVIDGIEL